MMVDNILAALEAVGVDIKALQDRIQVVQITQAAYTALPVKDPAVLYVVIG